MKSVNNKVRNVLTVVLVIALVVLSKYSFADSITVKNTIDTATTVKYLGSTNGQAVFQIEIENIQEEAFEISFVDADGIKFYSEIFSGKKIIKKFLLDIPESAYDNLQITIGNKKTSQSYKIEKTTRVVQNISVAKLK